MYDFRFTNNLFSIKAPRSPEFTNNTYLFAVLYIAISNNNNNNEIAVNSIKQWLLKQ